jgi:sulfur carrier protein
MRVIVNGQGYEIEEDAVLPDAARRIGIEPSSRGLAFAVDSEVVPREQVSAYGLREGQRVEIVAAIQGG